MEKPTLAEPSMGRSYLQDLLRDQAESKPPQTLLFYPLGNTSSPKEVLYSTLYSRAKINGVFIRSLEKFQSGCPILLHLSDHWDTVLWFWSILLAGGLPVLSSPLSNVEDHRHKHLKGLASLLESPICITRAEFVPLFDGDHTLELHTIENLSENNGGVYIEIDKLGNYEERLGNHECPGGRALAFLMLTSGSTGKAKLVCLTHHQVLAAVEGKASARPLPDGRPFLNWVGLDHVASLVEIHLQALWLGVGQIHVHAADIISSPKTFLDLLSNHRVSRSFSPNFFLAKLVSSVEPSLGPWDLSQLTLIASGGEANDVETCAAASILFHSYGAPRNVIATGFGMTETCAGAIYNLECPDYDLKNGNSISSLGKCIKGIEMRIVVITSEGDNKMTLPNEPGELQVRGDVVFKSYYRNPEATIEAFTPSGWFRTGDQAIIDREGNLSLIGRAKDVININGVKISSAEIQSTIEKTLGKRVDRVIIFPSKAAHTEQIAVAYIPNNGLALVDELVDIDERVIQSCIMCAGSYPIVFHLGKKSLSLLPTTTLGKVSRNKMKILFEEGIFSHDIDIHRQAIQDFRQNNQQIDLPANEVEANLAEDFAETLKIAPGTIGLDTSLFELGCTSMDLIRLKHRLDTRLGIMAPVVMLMKNPTVRSLAIALRPIISHDSARHSQPVLVDYDPVVILRSSGRKTPLWLFHPGVGEVLVFVGLAQQLSQDDRPVYALRARGFEVGQDRFPSIAVTVETYVRAIRQRQPRGPYALAGYSYGTMLAFEMAKKLNSDYGENSVRFLGSFNLPPHIKTRMRYLNWNMCLLNLAYFLGLTTEEVADTCEEKGFRDVSRSEALEQVLEVADRSRLEELGLGELELSRWADVAFGLQSMAKDYDPDGLVDVIDIFHAIPLKVAATSPEEWVTKHLSKWSDFCRTKPRFHRVGGAHYTMLGPDNVRGFSTTLQAALGARGV